MNDIKQTLARFTRDDGQTGKCSLNAYFSAMADGAHNSPDHNDPAIMARVAALAQALGLKMQGDDAQFFYMSEEEQVFVDDSDGLLILVSGDAVAWEVFDPGWDDAGDHDGDED